MNQATNNIELIYEKAKKYTETSLALYKLNAVDKSSDIISSLVYKLVLGFAVALFALFVNIGISLYLGAVLQNTYLGFFVVSLFYLAIAIVLYFFGNQLIKVPVNNLVISKLLQSKKTGKSILDTIKEETNEAA